MGIAFCHEDSHQIMSHVKLEIIFKYQIWKGTNPSLISKDRTTIGPQVLLELGEINISKIIRIKITDEKAWVKK